MTGPLARSGKPNLRSGFARYCTDSTRSPTEAVFGQDELSRGCLPAQLEALEKILTLNRVDPYPTRPDPAACEILREP